MQFIGLFLAAIVVEGIVNSLKPLFKKKKFQVEELLTVFLGVGISFIYQLDIFAIAGLTPLFPYAGIFLTGILLSRGSNYLYDIIKRIMGFPQSLQSSVNKEDPHANSIIDRAI